MQMDFRTAYDILTQVYELPDEDARNIAGHVENIIPPQTSVYEADPMLELLKETAQLVLAGYSAEVTQYLQAMVKNSQ